MNAFQTTKLCTSKTGDAFLNKVSPVGNQLLYSTYLGGTLNELNPVALAVDNSGKAHFTGR